MSDNATDYDELYGTRYLNPAMKYYTVDGQMNIFDFIPPISVSVTNSPADIDMSQMDAKQIHTELQRGYDDYKAGKTQDAKTVFNNILLNREP